MEPETTQLLQHLETAQAVAATANRTGLVGKILSWVPFRRGEGQPADPPNHRERALQVLRENAIETLAALELVAVEVVDQARSASARCSGSSSGETSLVWAGGSGRPFAV